MSCCIRTQGLSYHYDELTPALHEVDLCIPDNTFMAIVGRNGSGKTTLVKHFNGLLKPCEGAVWVYGVDTREASVAQLARQVGYVFQNPDHQIFCASTREEISFGPRNLGLDEAEVEERTEEALVAFDLVRYAEIPPAVLGYGLRRKVSVAAVYAMRPRILILDEPTAGLDWRSSQDLMERVTRLREDGHTIIMVSHNMRLVAEYVHEVLVMHQGRILVRAPTAEAFAQVEQLEKAQIRPSQIMRLARRLGMSGDTLTVPDFVREYGCARGRHA